MQTFQPGYTATLAVMHYGKIPPSCPHVTGKLICCLVVGAVFSPYFLSHFLLCYGNSPSGNHNSITVKAGIFKFLTSLYIPRTLLKLSFMENIKNLNGDTCFHLLNNTDSLTRAKVIGKVSAMVSTATLNIKKFAFESPWSPSDQPWSDRTKDTEHHSFWLLQVQHEAWCTVIDKYLFQWRDGYTGAR